MSRNRLSPEKWLTAGFDALVASGPTALAAEPLARALGTTKGSFYWHFKDVPAFQDALLTAWQTRALQHVLHAVQENGSAEIRLRTFGNAVLDDSIEQQLRIWGQTDPRATAVLAEVDAQRLPFIARLLGQMGLGNPDFALALQATLIGLPILGKPTNKAPFETLVDTILALE